VFETSVGVFVKGWKVRVRAENTTQKEQQEVRSQRPEVRTDGKAIAPVFLPTPDL